MAQTSSKTTSSGASSKTKTAAARAVRKPKLRAFETIAERIREMVVSGALKTGDRLPPERELAKQLGVGRPVLREALRKLESTGLLELRKGRNGGAFVSTGNPEAVSDGMSDLIQMRNISIEELFEARHWIQTTLVRIACRRAMPDDLDALSNNVRLAEQFHRTKKLTQRTEANIEFHNLLAQATYNPVMIIILRGLTDALRSLVHLVGSGQPRALFKTRHALVNAIREQDEEAAVEAMSRILNESEKMYRNLAKQRDMKRPRRVRTLIKGH